MEKNVQLVWLPVARMAALQDKSVKTIRRLIDEGLLISVKRTVSSGVNHTTKCFILVGQDMVDQDTALCHKLGQSPKYLGKEQITIHDREHTCLFVISYNKERKVEHGKVR
ncbi:MAG: hypothetical protein Q8M98_00595 [Candidatus Cloacimonadaceae bacterium]|nr:hypothetical protein [Candidatus Cloacimonadaceae bacterium]